MGTHKRIKSRTKWTRVTLRRRSHSGSRRSRDEPPASSRRREPSVSDGVVSKGNQTSEPRGFPSPGSLASPTAEPECKVQGSTETKPAGRRARRKGWQKSRYVQDLSHLVAPSAGTSAPCRRGEPTASGHTRTLSPLPLCGMSWRKKYSTTHHKEATNVHTRKDRG